MSRILIVYASSHGQTAKICRRISLMLSLDNHQVELRKADELPAETRFADFDGVLVAASVTYGKHQPYLTDLVTRRAGELNHVPSAFLSVCGALAGTWPDGPATAAKYVSEFIAKTGWHPNLTQSVAGAVAYTRYPFFTRMVMKLISARTGRPTDTSRDWEFTNWQEIDEFAAAMGRLVRPDAAVRPEVTEVS
jgi:menaquinone-dependent protoporphyrinogen oxidase